MFAIPLPPRPNLEQYKKLAKDLSRACKAGNREALREWSMRWLETLAPLLDLEKRPDFRERLMHQSNQLAEFALTKLADSKCALADAQFVIAQLHYFKTWPRFAKHLKEITSAGSTVSHFEIAADAVVSGELVTLERLLREDPGLIRASSTREHQATLLHYVAANGVEDFRQKTPKNAVEVSEMLLDAGAEVDAPNFDYGPGTTLGLVATSIHPWLAGVQNALLEILLDHGACVDGLPGGWNPLIAALHNDRPEAAAFLAARGARLDLEGAAGVGRLDVVKNFFPEQTSKTANSRKKPQPAHAGGSDPVDNDTVCLLHGATQAQLQSGFKWACEYGRKEVVEFLLDKAVDLRAGENTGQTALHLAAHRGQLEIIKILLDRGAPLEAKNGYGGTVLGQATWSVMHGDRRIEFVPVIEALLAAGATIEEADYPTGNAGVDQVLRRHGAKSTY